MNYRCEALALGIGNILWADEGFGVRAIEALHATYVFPGTVRLIDGGTQGLYLFPLIAAARRVLVLDAVDFGLAPGSLKVLRDAEVPTWSCGKLSPHQTGFNDVLALAALRGEAPEAITLIGVQPEVLADLGGSLRDPVRARIADAVELAASELSSWGFPGTRRGGRDFAPLNAQALDIEAYEAGRPSEVDACRIGDARVLARGRPQREA
jgi:hydrogenase maturation protease